MPGGVWKRYAIGASMEDESRLRRERSAVDGERREVLARLERWLETPMLVLGIAWLVLLVVELTDGLTPFLEAVGTAIWIVFIADFGLKLALAPDKGDYLKANWLTALALVVPALRVFRVVRVVRIFRAARAARGLRLFRLVTSLNRGMRALGRSFARRGFGYVIATTAVVIVAGAAGMYAFERGQPDGRGLDTYDEALWWTAMLLTSIGSEYWPRTGEGRLLCFLLSLYGFAVFGYVTATLATFFIGRDAESRHSAASADPGLDPLRAEIAALREEIRALGRDRSDPPRGRAA